MKQKILISFLIVALVALSVYVLLDERKNRDTLKVFTRCADSVVCYDRDGGYSASGSCFKNKELAKKYCKKSSK